MIRVTTYSKIDQGYGFHTDDDTPVTVGPTGKGRFWIQFGSGAASAVVFHFSRRALEQIIGGGQAALQDAQVAEAVQGEG